MLCPAECRQLFFQGDNMRLTVFGNNATCPEAHGACSSFLVEAGEKRILLDMGCGSLPNIRSCMDLKDLDGIVLSHLHFDHFGDLFCAKYHLETRMALGEPIPPIPLLAPHLPQWASEQLLPGEVFSYHPICDGSTFELGAVKIRFTSVPHLIESYAVEIYAEGKKLVYSGDSGICEELKQSARDADCFLCEATFPQGQTGEEKHHLSGAMAGKIAGMAQVKKLLLTHYHPHQQTQILREARSFLPNAELTQIGMCYEVE